MGIFGNSSPFDQDVERATSENSTSEEWGLIMEICDRAGASAAAGRDALRAVLRRLAHPDPHVQVHAATLLDALVSNAGRSFRLEVASRDFEHEYRRLLARAQPPVRARLRAMLRKWAEGDFRNDPQLDLIPSLHAKLGDAPRAVSPPPTASTTAAPPGPPPHDTEQDDLARAIALSLSEASPAVAPAVAPTVPEPLYPRVERAEPERRVRALYDFEAAEDNELTFVAGEIVHVMDSSDPNWWKGRNSRGEGLFPANFVTSEEEVTEVRAASPTAVTAVAPTEMETRTETETEMERPLQLDEGEMDAVLCALHEADPSRIDLDERALSDRETRALAMGSLVDAALERADTRHARLTQLSAELVDALKLYHELMRDPRPLHPPPHPHHHHHPPHVTFRPPHPPPPSVP